MDDVKLMMVTENNNNKFYRMHDNNDGTFTVTWGRVGTEGSQTTYPISQWSSKYNSKVNVIPSNNCGLVVNNPDHIKKQLAKVVIIKDLFLLLFTK